VTQKVHCIGVASIGGSSQQVNHLSADFAFLVEAIEQIIVSQSKFSFQIALFYVWPPQSFNRRPIVFLMEGLCRINQLLPSDGVHALLFPQRSQRIDARSAPSRNCGSQKHDRSDRAKNC
jgi:hypothetical protein